MSNPIFDNLTALAREGTLTAATILEQMIEDRKTADSYDPADYDSRIEANAAWWCLNPETRRQLLGLTKQEQKEIALAILSESAWGPMFFRDFEPEVFDWLAELTSSQDVLMAGIGMVGKTCWIEWAITHFEKDKVRAIIFHCLREQPQAAKEFLGSSGGWNATYWRLFDTVPRFLAAIKAVTKHHPSRVISSWSHIGAYLTRVGSGHSIDEAEHPWGFLPHDGKEIRKLAEPSMEHVTDILRDAFAGLGENERIHPYALRHFPLDLRLTALKHVKRLDEGIELSVGILLQLGKSDMRGAAVLEELLSRMTSQNAPFVYVHALACKMDKKPGDFAYTRVKRIRGGRHHASRGQRGIWQEPFEEEKKELIESLVRKAWFYPQLRQRLLDCGWEFISPKALEYRTEHSFGRRYVYLEEATLVLSFLPPVNDLQWLHLENGLDIIVPTRPWREADEETEVCGKRYLDFRGLTPLFDAPLRMDFLDEIEKKTIEAARRHEEQHRSGRYGRRF